MGDYRQKREHIVGTAAGLVHVKGFNNTSIEDILKAGGIGRGQFFYYFRSKEELGYAILERQSRATAEKIWDPALESDLQPLERIYRLLDNVIKVYRQRGCTGGCPIGSLAVEMSDIHEGFRRKACEVFRSWTRRLREALHEGVQKGQLKKDISVAEVADFIVASIQGAILLCVTRKDLKSMRHCFKNLRSYLETLRA